MALITRDIFTALVKQIRTDKTTPVYLLVGDRFLCQQAAQEITAALGGDSGTIHTIDGENEIFTNTISKLLSYSLFPGRQIFKVTDTKLFHSKNIAQAIWKKAIKAKNDTKLEDCAKFLYSMAQIAGFAADKDSQNLESMNKTQWKKAFAFTRPEESLAWTNSILSMHQINQTDSDNKQHDNPEVLLEDTLSSGIPTQNYLLLLSEVVDKRKRFFKFLKDHHTVIDLSVDTGSSSHAKKEQRTVLLDLIHSTLKKFNKKASNKIADLLIERVGFHPVAIVMETEKLALYTGENANIDKHDLDTMVGRTRQEALFELTGALGNKNLESALYLAERLQDNGIHGLAIIATLRNYARNLLLFRSLQEQTQVGYNNAMTASSFQKQCLPILKNLDNWKKEINIHPYALFMQFNTASYFSLSLLKKWLTLLLSAELKLKGSQIHSSTVIQHLLLTMLGKPMTGALKKKH